MRNAGSNLTSCTIYQAYSCVGSAAVPHPTSLRSATFPPGEGFHGAYRFVRETILYMIFSKPGILPIEKAVKQ